MGGHPFDIIGIYVHQPFTLLKHIIVIRLSDRRHSDKSHGCRSVLVLDRHYR